MQNIPTRNDDLDDFDDNEDEWAQKKGLNP